MREPVCKLKNKTGKGIDQKRKELPKIEKISVQNENASGTK